MPYICEIPSASDSCSAQTTTQPNGPTCPPGYAYYGIWNTCYKYVNVGMSFQDAEINCANEGGHLVSIHSEDEDEFVDSMMHNFTATDSIWIGFKDDSTDLSSIRWTWTDNTPVTYTVESEQSRGD
uniref:C-type lectin domain-containing protein n=1 Tax=Acrobeloides nanus TaxID=290746 RepID=A0A914C3K2_9BILA